MSHCIQLGHVTSVFGVKGWVKVFSETRPRTNILNFKQWRLAPEGRDDWRSVEVLESKRQGKTLIARLDGCDDRDQAKALVGMRIAILRSELPEPKPGEYYWVDVEGLSVCNLDGVDLGSVSHLIETGANDVLVVRGDRERLIPFVEPQFVKKLDFDSRRLVVDWDPEF